LFFEKTKVPLLINTSLVDTDLFPKAILPTDVTINSRNTNVSVTEVGETYTQVEVVSNRILFGGTLTTKNFGVGQKTMDRNWEWLDEKNYAYGSNDGIIGGGANSGGTATLNYPNVRIGSVSFYNRE
jgi:hypothetical protein